MLRFAPSPTSDMHIDSLRLAIFNYIVSRQKNEGFIVRIEDTDKKSNIDGKDKEILDILGVFGIEYSQVIHQSENVRFHTAMALQLMHEKKAFSCFCSDNWLNKKRQEAKDANIEYTYDDACRNLPAELVIDNDNPFTVRVTRPDNAIIMNDQIKGKLNFDKDSVDSFVIMTQNKIPTYNFSCAVDDMLSDISMIIRSEKNITNTPKQDHIRTSLSYDKKIEYAHLPTIDNESPSVKSLLEDGFLPDAIVNYLILMGNDTPQEIFNMNDAIEWLDLSKISDKPVHFDINILKNINHQHLNNLDAKELSRYVGFADEDIGKLAKVYLTEASTTKELKSKIAPIFKSKELPKELAGSAKAIAEVIKNAPFFKEYTEFENYVLKESKLDKNKFLKTFRYILTNTENGPDIADIYKYLKNYIGEIIK